MVIGPNDIVYMNSGECTTTDKIMQASAERPWNLWKRKVQREMRRAAADDAT